jgi:hypothetical protein
MQVSENHRYMLRESYETQIQRGSKMLTRSALFWDVTLRRVVTLYHTTPRNIPEERRSRQHRGGSLKSKQNFEFLNVSYTVLQRMKAIHTNYYYYYYYYYYKLNFAPFSTSMFSTLITLLTWPILYIKIQFVPHRKHLMHTVFSWRTTCIFAFNGSPRRQYVHIVDSDIKSPYHRCLLAKSTRQEVTTVQNILYLNDRKENALLSFYNNG